MALSLSQHGQAQIDRDVDQTAIRVGALVAVSLTKDSQANIDGNIDQRTLAATGRGLVTLGFSKDCKTGVNRHVDQATRGCSLLLALGLAKDSSA
jgi:hypothetical protein